MGPGAEDSKKFFFTEICHLCIIQNNIIVVLYIARILVDLNLAVRYRIAIRIYASRKFWQNLIWRL